MTDKLYINEWGDEDMCTEVWIFKTQKGTTGEKSINSGQILVVYNDNAGDFKLINDIWDSIGRGCESSKVFNNEEEFNMVIDRINTEKNVNIDVNKNFKKFTFDELLKEVDTFLII